MCPAAGHGAWGDHRGVPGGPAEPQLERAEGCPVSEGTTTSCPLWLSGTLKTVLRLCSHSLPPYPHPLPLPRPGPAPLRPSVSHGTTLCSPGGAALWSGSAATRRVPQRAGDVRLEPGTGRLPPTGLLRPCPPQVSIPCICCFPVPGLPGAASLGVANIARPDTGLQARRREGVPIPQDRQFSRKTVSPKHVCLDFIASLFR